MRKTPLPTPQQVRETLQMLLGREVEVETGADMVNPQSEGGVVVGVFDAQPGNKLAALWVSDLPLSAYIGAALGLIPARTAEESAQLGLNETISENLREVINVAGSLLNCDGAPHVTLSSVYAPGEWLPADVAQWVMAYVPREDLKVVVPGYGEGCLSILVP
ncbi:MAG: hypothetical protein L6311_12340 [Cellulomonas sp.]|nr:hypothetical protein [Cellulomonas sp.]